MYVVEEKLKQHYYVLHNQSIPNFFLGFSFSEQYKVSEFHTVQASRRDFHFRM